MESFKRSLEELFSDFTPPAPEGISAPGEEEPSAPTPALRQPAEAIPSREEIVRQGELAIPLVGAHVRNLRAQLLGNALLILVAIIWTAFLIGSAMARINRALVQVGEETRRANAALLASRAAADFFTAIGQSTLVGSSEQFVSNVTAAREGLREAQQRLLESAASLPRTDPLWAELARLRASVVQVDSWTDYLMRQAQANHWKNLRDLQMHLIPYYRGEIAETTVRVEQITEERLAAARAEADTARQMMLNVAISWGAVLRWWFWGSTSRARSIAEPLERLTQASTQLAAGRLETRVAIDRADEFGRLAQAFNEMADRLQALYNELEDRVRERTRALQEANYALQRRAIQLEATAR